jgi:hypothetical protein
MHILTKDMALEFLKKSLLNKNISFREGQYEAIDAVVNKRKKFWLSKKQDGEKVAYILFPQNF